MGIEIGGRTAHSSIIGTAKSDDASGSVPLAFVCNNSVNFIVNDDATNDLYVNFDAPINAAGTILLKAGEVVNDLRMSCRTIYVKASSSTVNFRAVGS